jgi:predicted nucleic acid-binding protein
VGVLIDTSVLVAIERHEVRAEEAGEGPQAISVVSVSELLHGVHRSDAARRTVRRLIVERLLSRFDSLPITDEVARVHAEVGADLAAAGTPVSTNDLWIAATALVHDLAIATRDRRSFERIPGVRVLTI